MDKATEERLKTMMDYYREKAKAFNVSLEAFLLLVLSEQLRDTGETITDYLTEKRKE